MSFPELVKTLEMQDEVLGQLGDLLIRQREALRDGRLQVLQDLFREMQFLSVKAQALEGKRVRLCAALASGLGCEPVVSEMCERLSPEEGELLKARGRALANRVGLLRSEMKLLEMLMDEARMLNEMMISEWRRMRAPFDEAGGFNARI
ncbi:MAG: flagellar protein FlgN [Thermanaerothrix sp.]|nr:flagellar protein FlgN [Thermanaerothrix sp.]